jgi:ADP-ribose pyrophosphatase YjhB (NUDIX family)
VSNEIDVAISILDSLCMRAKELNEHEIMQGAEGERKHALDVLDRITKKNSNASIELKLAALFHDVDRLVNTDKAGGFKGDRNSNEYLMHKKRHAIRSATIIIPLLLDNGFSKKTTDRVEFLITHHDDTGDEIEKLNDEELNQLVAADSSAFFTSIAPKLYASEGEKRIKDKIQFMIEKMPTDSRNILWQTELENNLFESLKNNEIKDYYLKNSIREKAYKYCPTCKAALHRKKIDNESFLSCIDCGFVYWNPPFPVTSVVIKRENEVLLMKRAQEPLLGYWCCPGGYIKYYEDAKTAAIREVQEETGYEISISKLIGVFQIDNDPRGLNIDIIYEGKISKGVLTLSDEGAKLEWHEVNNLPKRIAYKHRDAILESL